MTTERELFKTILDNPKEDAPRLMYADWLDGEKPAPTPSDRTQAEFIRVQVSLARDSDPATGGPLTPTRMAELRVREKELRETIIDTHLAELYGTDIAKAVGGDAGRIFFDRGIVMDLYLAYTHIAKLPDGLQVSGDLDLPYTWITTLPDGLKVGGNLDLSYTKIKALPTGLKVGGHLYLSNTPIKALPDDLQVGGRLTLEDTRLSRGTIQRIPDMPGLSTEAQITGLRSIGFDALADQVERATARPHGGRS